MTQSYDIFLKDAQTGKNLPGVLIDRVDRIFAKRADDTWIPFLDDEKANSKAANLPFSHQEHGGWQWDKKVEAAANMLALPTMGIECEGQIQGMMMLMTDGAFGRLPAQKDLPLVYIYFLATAPWNLATVKANIRFKGVGDIFLRAAIETSLDLDFKGRIGLHSLPQSETWYEQHGMISLGHDSKKENLKYYEMTADQSAVFLR